MMDNRNDLPSLQIRKEWKTYKSNQQNVESQITRIGILLDHVFINTGPLAPPQAPPVPTKQNVNATDPYEVQVLAKVKELGITVEGIELLAELRDRVEPFANTSPHTNVDKFMLNMAEPFKTNLVLALHKRKYE